MTVDGDTSTNDTVLALSSGLAGGDVISDEGSDEAVQLQAALTALCQGLSKAIAWDGEGATVMTEVLVKGAPSKEGAATIARSVASSSLFKSAVYGRDPNWGRIACAAGYAGVPFDPTKLKISLGDIVLMENGQPLEFDEKAASKYMADAADVRQQGGTVYITLDLCSGGTEEGLAWGCDLTYDYVKINAEYTT